jgi:hypothetical protein
MRAILIPIVFVLAACAAQGGPARRAVANRADCAVIEAVLKQHYEIRADTPYRLDRGDGPRANGERAFRIRCQFPDVPIKSYDHNAPHTPPPNFQAWIKFPAAPTYPDKGVAIIEAGSLLGPLAGSGVKCTLKRAGDAWHVEKCGMTWIS